MTFQSKPKPDIIELLVYRTIENGEAESSIDFAWYFKCVPRSADALFQYSYVVSPLLKASKERIWKTTVWRGFQSIFWEMSLSDQVLSSGKILSIGNLQEEKSFLTFQTRPDDIPLSALHLTSTSTVQHLSPDSNTSGCQQRHSPSSNCLPEGQPDPQVQTLTHIHTTTLFPPQMSTPVAE